MGLNMEVTCEDSEDCAESAEETNTDQDDKETGDDEDIGDHKENDDDKETVNDVTETVKQGCIKFIYIFILKIPKVIERKKR